MFERYTEKARRAIFFARYEASQFGSPWIESEHLLLGILREDKALAHRFLRSGASVESIRQQIEAHTVIRHKVSTSVDLPLSDECRRILACSAEEVDHFSHKFVGTTHLFLGILREPDCFAAKLLNARGVFLDASREQAAQDPPQPLISSPRWPGLPSGYKSQRLLYNRAAETLVHELRRAGARHLPTRLFVRHKDKEAIEQIGNPAEDISYESPVTCEKHPVLVFNSLKLDEARKGWDWDGVYSFDLNSKDLALVISPEKLRFSEPHGRLSIVQLVSLSEDARTVYVTIGIEKVVSGGGVVHYHLAKIDFADQEVRILSRLMDLSS
jgi:hypothetical protein